MLPYDNTGCKRVNTRYIIFILFGFCNFSKNFIYFSGFCYNSPKLLKLKKISEKERRQEKKKAADVNAYVRN